MHSSTSPIPQFNTKLEKNKYIPSTAAQLSQSEDPETKTFLLSFKYYRDDLCQIVNLNKNGGKRGLQNIRIIGKCYNKVSLRQNNIDTKFITNNGAYKTLYNGLAPDIEVLEHKIQSTARLFYFITDKYFYIRAITNTHIELDKHR